LRKAIGALAILAFMAMYIAVAAVIGDRVAKEHWAIQLVFFPIAGLLWVLPLRPLLRWIHAKDEPSQSPDV
jgi:membrane protein implicated in regulation of membrane protease activity